MSYYQGRALRTDAPRRQGGRLRRVAWLLALFGMIAVIAQVPWAALRMRLFDVRDIRVEGARYLDASAVVRASGVHPGADLLGVDLARARQGLLMHPRIAAARVSRSFPHDLRLRVEERVPVLLIEHGSPWEMDSSGVLLPPLEAGVVADVPLLVGPALATVPPGTQVQSPAVSRGLAWVRAVGARDLRLGGNISEIDVSDPGATELTLMNGTRVLSSAWPPGTRTLSALRVVLADLQQRGTVAREVDLRFENQVIVRPASNKSGEAARTS